MKFQEKSVDTLLSNAFQPKYRTEKRKLNPLLRSIKVKGLLQPIFIDKHNQVIDGHRRLACYRELGYKKIPAIIYNGEVSHLDKGEIFVESNAFNRALNSHDYLGIYLKGGIVPNNISKIIAFICEKINRSYLRKIYNSGYSPYSVRRAYRIFDWNAMGNHGITFEQLCDWTIKYNMFTTLRICEDNGFDLQALINAIKTNIRFEFKLKNKEN